MLPLTAALLIPTRALWEQAHACIQNLPVRIAMEQSERCEADAVLDRIEKHRVDAVLVEADILSVPLEEFVARLREMTAQPAVFVLHTEASPRNILEALRAGASEYLHPPLADTLRDALERLSASRSRGADSGAGGIGRVFGFLSARGGCGATTIAVHAAADLARHLGKPVLAADFDFEAGVLRFLLKTRHVYSVRDALDNLHRMDWNYWKALVSSLPNQLDVIQAPDEPAAKRSGTPAEMAHLLRFARSQYPATIADFGRCVSPAALDSLPEIDTLYLISTLDIITLEHTSRALRVIGERGFSASRVKVFLNRVPDRGIPDLTGVEKMIGQPCAGFFTGNFIGLYNAWSEGHLIGPSEPLGKQFHVLAESMRARVNGQREEPELPPAPASNRPHRWLSFLQKEQQ